MIVVDVECVPLNGEKFPRRIGRFGFDKDQVYWLNLGLVYHNHEGNENYWYRKAK